VAFEGMRDVFVGEDLRRLRDARDDQHRDSVAKVKKSGTDDVIESRARVASLYRGSRIRSHRCVSTLAVLDPLGGFDLGTKESSYHRDIGGRDRRFEGRCLNRSNRGIEYDFFTCRILDRRSEDLFRIGDGRHQHQALIQTRKERG
jgi:hypothetical protein